MFKEFFYHPTLKIRLFAWLGGFFIMFMAAGMQFVSLLTTLWQGDFFDTIQRMMEAENPPVYDEATRVILSKSLDYVRLLIPQMIMSPFLRRVIRQYTLEWRFTLMETYVTDWLRDDLGSIEGASQRVQEDTQKFANGVQMIAFELVSAVFSLVIFGPFLVALGTKVPPPFMSTGGGWADYWLLLTAICLSSAGLVVASFVARALVVIDMDNQKIEAAFRKQMVYAEKGGAPKQAEAAPSRMLGSRRNSMTDAGQRPSVFLNAAISTFTYLRKNYGVMYNNLVAIDAWNATYARIVQVLPFLLAAPKLFEPNSTVGLGDLQMLRFVFFDVFSALNAFAANWPAINELRATTRRLHEFEIQRAALAKIQIQKQAFTSTVPVQTPPMTNFFSSKSEKADPSRKVTGARDMV